MTFRKKLLTPRDKHMITIMFSAREVDFIVYGLSNTDDPKIYFCLQNDRENLANELSKAYQVEIYL